MFKKIKFNFLCGEKGYFFLLSSLSLLFFILYLHKLNYQSLWMDEGFYILAAKKILKYFYPLYPSGYVLYKSVFYSYMLAIFSFFFGQSVFSYRLFSVFIFTITPLAVFKLTKQYVDKKVILTAGIIFFMFTWEVEFSRVAVYYSLVQFLFTISIFSFINYTFLKKQNKYYFFWILSALTHQLSIALSFTFPVLALLKPKIFFKKKNLLSLLFWVPFFIFIMVQEVLFWKVGQVYSNQSAQAEKITGIIDYFFKNFNLVYFKLLYTSHPNTFPVFIIGTIILVFFIISKKFILKKEVKESIMIFVFLSLTLIITLFSMGFMKTHPMPRYLFPFHFIYLLIVIYYFNVFINIFTKFLPPIFKKNTFKTLTLILITYFSFNQVRFTKILKIINRDYDNRIITDIITSSGRFYPIDHQSLGQYVKTNLRNEDIIISVHMVFQYLYIGRVDYWLFTGGPGTWDAWEKVNGRWREFYLGSEWINSLQKLKLIIKKHNSRNKRVWIITSPSEENPAHINYEIQNYLKENKNKVVWISRDGIGKVYLFSPFQLSPRKHSYEAEWGIYKKGSLKNIDNKLFVKIGKTFYKTSLIFNGIGKKKIELNLLPLVNPSTLLIEVSRSGIAETKKILHINKNRKHIYFFIKFKKRDRYNLKLKKINGSDILLDSMDF